MGLTYGNLTLIYSRPIVADRTGNDGYFVGMLFEVWAQMHLVPRNISGKTGMIWRTSTFGVG